MVLGSLAKTSGPFLWLETVGFADIPAHSPLHHLHEYWTKRARDGRLPSRADVDPVHLGATLLPWIVLLDVVRADAALDYRYRLLGTANVTLLGIDRTGEMLSENLDAADVVTIKKSFDDVVITREPVFTKAGIPHKHDFLVTVYRAFYPLAGDGVNVDMVIGAAIPEDKKL